MVQYKQGGYFNVHHDSSQFHPRLLTALAYLNEPLHTSEREQNDSGNDSEITDLLSGGTWFPFAGAVPSGVYDNLNTTEEAIELALSWKHDHDTVGTPLPGLVVRPEKCNGVIFFNYLSDGRPDPLAVHAGLPLISGGSEGEEAGGGEEKWIANYWVSFDLTF